MLAAPEGQHALLVAVLRRVNTATLDFQAVGDELGITKSAASKRWARFVEKTLKTSGMAAESKEKKTAPKRGGAKKGGTKGQNGGDGAVVSGGEEEG